ncbi:MAG: radical SAM protein [Bacillota bacterium]|nr:radical SAM protein [Bacillota bacterium]
MRNEAEAKAELAYVRLNPEYQFVEGASAGALYNVGSGDVISLGVREASIVEMLERNEPVADVIAKLGTEVDCDVQRFVEDLCLRGIAAQYKRPRYIDKLRITRFSEERWYQQAPSLGIAFLSLGGECELKCEFCAYPRRFECLGCRCFHEPPPDAHVVRAILAELSSFGCRSVALIGGDPMFRWDITQEVIRRAKDLSIDGIYLVSSGFTLPTDLTLLSEAGVKILIQVFTPVTAYSRCLNEGTEIPSSILQRIAANLSGLRAAGIAFDVILSEVLDEADRPDSMTVPDGFGDVLRGARVDHNRISARTERLVNSPRDISRVSVEMFYRRAHYHPCLGGKVFVHTDGTVSPCPGMPELAVGNLLDQSLSQMYSRIEPWWGLTLDRLDPCRRCEFRYACVDCRALERHAGVTGNKKSLCSYNPETAAWRAVG